MVGKLKEIQIQKSFFFSYMSYPHTQYACTHIWVHVYVCLKLEIIVFCTFSLEFYCSSSFVLAVTWPVSIVWRSHLVGPPVLLSIVNKWGCTVSPPRATGRSLQIPYWQRGSSTLSGELLHLQLLESKVWALATLLRHTYTINYSRQIMETMGML